MPITNAIKISPNTSQPTQSDGVSAQVTEGIYDAEIADITYIPPEENLKFGKPQLRFKFKILGGEFDGVNLSSWVSMSINPGGFAVEGGTGAPSHLYTIAKSVMGEEPDPNAEFYPNVLIGGKLKIWVEVRVSQAGKEYSRVVKYSAMSKTAKSTKVVAPKEEEIPLPEEPEGEEDVNVDDLPF